MTGYTSTAKALHWLTAALVFALLGLGLLMKRGNLAFADKRLDTWTVAREHDRIQVPAALVAAAGVAPLLIADERIVFDIPKLLDATLEFQPPAGQA